MDLKWKGLPVVIFGAGGIAKETLHIIEEINDSNRSNVFDFIGFVEGEKNLVSKEVTKGYNVVSSDGDFIEFSKEYKILGVVIPFGTPKIKKTVYEKLKNIENIVFPNIIHPNVTFDKNTVSLGVGNLLTSGVMLTNDIEIGDFNLINANSTIGHDTNIGSFNVINSLASIAGSVKIGNCCLVGTGANVLQTLKIGDNSIVGAGSVVVKNVMENQTVMGIPATRL